ncbi:alpha/beta fold hydrolase [Streptomyces sp. PmtG]
MSAAPFPLVCLPFAGSGAGFYREWTKRPDHGVSVTVLPVQLPGREELFLDEAFTDVTEAAAKLALQVAELVADVPRFGLFGHSLGAVLAYEIARELVRLGEPGLAHLYVSGSPGPWAGRDDRATGLDDEQFLARVQDFAGYRHAALDDPALRELLLPSLRVDVAMHENYKPSSKEPLDIPVTSMRGAQDTLVSEEHARQWQSATNGAFSYREFPGGHMYLTDDPDAVLKAVGDR